WELALLPTAAWGTTAGTAQFVKGALKGANSGSFDKLRARLYPNLSTSQVRTAPLRRLSGRSVDEAEKTLKLSKVVSIDPSELWKGGANNPSLVTLEDGTKAVWKPRQNKLYSNYRAEVLAYELDRKFGFNLVPPTVERTINGKKGSLQLYREHKFEDLDYTFRFLRGLERGPSPESSVKTSQDMKKQEVFDILIENTDRNLKDIFIVDGNIHSLHKNYLISPGGNVISIDNGIGFTGKKERGFRLQVHLFREAISEFRELDESKTIIENMRSSLTVEFEEEIADYLGKEDTAHLIDRMRGIVRIYDLQ
ncbi:MAG: hypothetical protein OXM55_07980, partial [Bdellovibrionales bacterium]|nr:hypothetical protein [Bdellovibrionales bacterium]